MAATLGEALKQMIAEVEAAQRGGGGGYATAEADLRQLRGMQQAWAHYAARAPRACAEAFGEAVQHDAPTLNPAVDAGFSRFLAQALLDVERDPRVDQKVVAAGLAFFCLSDPRALKLTEVKGGRKLDALADKHPDSWYLHYTKATWRQLREDRQASLKALTKAIQAGGPCGLLYTRGRVLSSLKKKELAAADYGRFLQLAPPDHRSVPDAHYALALDMLMIDGANADLAAARQHFEQGQRAEAQVAPWVGYQPSEAKMYCSMMLSAPAFRGK